jgi:hypothetical protein
MFLIRQVPQIGALRSRSGGLDLCADLPDLRDFE